MEGFGILRSIAPVSFRIARATMSSRNRISSGIFGASGLEPKPSLSPLTYKSAADMRFTAPHAETQLFAWMQDSTGGKSHEAIPC